MYNLKYTHLTPLKAHHGISIHIVEMDVREVLQVQALPDNLPQEFAEVLKVLIIFKSSLCFEMLSLSRWISSSTMLA
jgi:hypothetical protein